jgi:hypothetical protein
MMQRNNPKYPGLTELMKSLLGIVPYKSILCSERWHFASDQGAKLVSDSLNRMAKNDVLRYRNWNSAPEKQVSDEKTIKAGIFHHKPSQCRAIRTSELLPFLINLSDQIS